MKRKTLKDIFNISLSDEDITVTLCGWIRTRRESKGGFSFIEINDGSTQKNLQIVADNTLPNYNSEISKLYPGASIAVTGKLCKSPASGQDRELKAEEIKVLGFCDPLEYPIGKQRVSFERLREIAHLRPRTSTFGAIARVRNALAIVTHDFFQSKGFLYLNTPIITANDCEGAGEMFQVTTLDISKPPRLQDGEIDYSHDFFGRKANLTVSGQLEGESYACALGNIYTFGPTFRAENSNTRRHLAEFWMIEPEMAFADLNDDATLAEEYLKHLFATVIEKCPNELAFLSKFIEAGLTEKLAKLANSSFKRLTYTEAVEILEKSGEVFEFEPHWGMDLQSEHERYLTEKVFDSPVIVTDFPKQIKAFYMRLNDDGKTVAAMDILVPGVGEIVGGSQREERLDILEKRMIECGLNPKDYWWYCELRKFGSVPHAGFGLGFERIVQFCTGMHNIRDVIPFPRTPGNAEF
ncbi:MAG: asparagine--tRNA ligase [Candidatus Nanoarchaeia archaeon]